MLRIVESVGGVTYTVADSLRDVVHMAMELERSGAARYGELRPHVNGQGSAILVALVSDGLAHYQALQEILHDPRLKDVLNGYAHVRRRNVSLPDLPESPEEDDVLDYAEMREHLAYDFYDRLCNLLDPSPLRDLVRRLRERKRQREEEVRRACSALFLIF